MKTIVICIFATFLTNLAWATESETLFISPNGLQEACVALAKIPGGNYSKKDLKKQQELCAINFYDSAYAVCPKTWSTSPATMIYSLADSEFTAPTYEVSSYCGSTKKKKAAGVKTAAKFKNTMNQLGTSGTFSQSSLLYYHFSRLLDTKTKIPVSVYREMDRKVHHQRVTKKALSKVSKGQIRAGWDWMNKAGVNPKSYKPTTDIVTDDLAKFYGILIRGKGKRYSHLYYGHRPGWGQSDAEAWEDTPHFLALRDPNPLPVAIEMGIQKAWNIKRMAKSMDDNLSDQQMLLWMREVVEITLLDFIFSQQDRIGNVDYQWYWLYVENGEVQSKREKRDPYEDYPRSKIKQIPVPEKLAAFNPVLVQKTNLNDNDAGGRIAYANWAKPKYAGWLEDFSHYSAKLYKKLMALDKDLQTKGPVYQWLESSIDLTPRRIRQIVANTNLAANTIRAQCYEMRFDLDNSDNFLVNGFQEGVVDCSVH